MARSVNKVILLGNVGRDPEIRYTSSGAPIATISLATNRSRQDANGNWTDETEWHRVIAWERQAEFIMNYVNKGRKLYVEGRLQTRKWTDKNGVERYTTEVVAREIIAVDRAQEDGDEDWGDTPAPRPATRPRQQPTAAERSAERKMTGVDDELMVDEFEDVPFD